MGEPSDDHIRSMTTSERCTWCQNPVDRDEGHRAREDPGARRAVFCRLEHVVPWAMQGAHWEAGDPGAAPLGEESLNTCARCDQALADTRVTLVRHRGEHRIPDAFCSVDHLAEWANAGGRYARPA
jgi:hypothetical protein